MSAKISCFRHSSKISSYNIHMLLSSSLLIEVENSLQNIETNILSKSSQNI